MTTAPAAPAARLREAATVVILEAELSAWLEEAADAAVDPVHEVSEWPDDDPDESPRCVDDCVACVGLPVALALADAILAAVTR